MPLRAAELEVLFTANTADIDKAEKTVKTTGERIEKKPITAKVTADEKAALAGMDRVEAQAKRIVSAKTAATVEANIDRAEKNLTRVTERLDYLKSVRTELDVEADIRRAEANLNKMGRNLDGLRSARTTMEIDADTIPAENALADVKGAAGEAGGDAGSEFGANIIAALVSIPIAGAVIGVGVAAAKGLIGAFNEGLAQEKGYDRLQALTGIDEADALRLGRAAGEAYANTFGESIEANMDTARLALQFDLVDDASSTRSAQKVVEGLSGIADVLEEDVRPVAATVATLLSSGVAKSADEAFDLIAAGARNGLNRNEDLLDTLTEYPALFKRLGLSGPEALGLISQGLSAGARNSDIAADALKEFQIRATDASETSAEGFEALGFSAEEMTAKIATGGAGAREGLEQVLGRLREMEDPVARNAAAVALFGTQAEDMGEALFAMDLSTAVAQLDGVEGSAKRMFDTLANNDSTKMEQAGRNIEVAADGIKGALAAAFSEPIGELADFVSENRGPVLQFMLDLANGALDFGESMVNAAADSTIALGEFIAGPGAQAVDTLIAIQKSLNPFADTSALEGLRDGMKEFDDVSAAAAETMRTKLIDEGIDPARAKLNEFGDGAVAMGFLNDASLRLAGALDGVGVGADGAVSSLDGIDLAHLRVSESGRDLEAQVRNAVIAMQDEQVAASTAGEAQEALAERYQLGTEALLGQLTQMGLTQEQAQALIDTVLQTPTEATTTFGSNVIEEKAEVQSLADRITTLPNGSVVVSAETETAYSKLMDLQAALRSVTGNQSLHIATGAGGQGGLTMATGGVVEFMAQGGIRGLTPMQPVAQVVPANTWRVVGDRGDVPESFIPLDGSPRSMSILLDTMQRMGVSADQGAAVGVTASGSGGGETYVQVDVHVPPGPDASTQGRIIGARISEIVGERK